MLSQTLLAGVVGLLLAVGCGPGVDPGGAKLDEPWRSMNLPVGEGQADQSDGDLHVAYTDGQYATPAAALAQWSRALERAGWKKKGDPYRIARLVVTDFERGEQSLSLMVSGNGKRVDVHLVPE